MIGALAGGWINAHYGWRAAFLVMGLPGLVLALVVRMTLKEPRRRIVARSIDARRGSHRCSETPRIGGTGGKGPAFDRRTCAARARLSGRALF